MFVPEAAGAGFRLGVEFGVVWAAASSTALRFGLGHLRKGACAGLAAAALATLPFLLGRAAGPPALPQIIQTSFAFFLIASAAGFLHSSDLPLFGGAGGIWPARGEARAWEAAPAWEAPRARWAAQGIVFLFAVIFALPEGWGIAAFLREVSSFRGLDRGDCLFSAFLGAAPPAAWIIVAGARFDRGAGGGIGSFFRLPQLLLLAAVAKLAAGAAGGPGELSLVPVVQRGIMKFCHDFLHQTLVLFMVPDHPLLRSTVWNFIGVFFGSNLASFAALALLLCLPVFFLFRDAARPLPEASGATGAHGRRSRYLALTARRREAVPVAAFLLLVMTLWFSGRGESMSPVHRPVPNPVVSDRGIVVIPLKDPTMNLSSGALHKFVLLQGGERISFFVVKKKENELAVCLDACEVCPADGYGQSGNHIVCLYCATPIPVESLGEAGGCNPIPVLSFRGGASLQIKAEDLAREWRRAHTAGASE